MATTGSTNSTSGKSIGTYVKLAGGAAFVVGGILSLHHYAIGICFVGGAAAFFVGKKLQGM